MAESALETALSEGCPESLFRGLCDWIEPPEYVVDSDRVEIRYSPNTRAQALGYWQLLDKLFASRFGPRESASAPESEGEDD